MTYDPKKLCQSTKSALVVMDMQNDFVADKGAFSLAGFDVKPYQKLEPIIYEMIVSARQNHIPIIFVAMSHNEQNDGDGAWKQRRIENGHPNSCREETWGSHLYGRLKPDKDDAFFFKWRYSAFVNEQFDTYLQGHKIETLIFAGINTNTCVESTMREAHMRDYHVLLIKDATTCAYKDAYEPSLKNIERHFGAVISSDEWKTFYCSKQKPEKIEN